MKRILPLLFVLLFLPFAALALPYPEETVLSVLPLTPAQQALRDFLYTPLFNGRAEIQLPEGARYDDVAPAVNALMQDYPELFHLDRNYTVTYYRDDPDHAVSLRPTYRVTAEEAAHFRAALYAQAYLLADADPDPLALHDKLCALAEYGGESELRHTAVGALLQGEANCEGYAHALTLLYRMAGIPCGIVTGTALDSSGRTERHSWNLARLTGFTLIDPTWNDQGNVNTHWYYGLSAMQMGADHVPDEGLVLPDCGDQDNWHVWHGAVVAGQAGADEALRRLVRGESLNLRVTDPALFAALAEDTYDYIGGYNERYPEEAFYGAYSVMHSDAQGCVIIERAE